MKPVPKASHVAEAVELYKEGYSPSAAINLVNSKYNLKKGHGLLTDTRVRNEVVRLGIKRGPTEARKISQKLGHYGAYSPMFRKEP